jgi:hypothetical protein
MKRIKKRTLEVIEAEIEIARSKYDEIFKSVGKYPTFELYQEAIEPFSDKLDELSREKRMIMPYELQDIPNNSDVMSLNAFIEAVKDGWFIDYDGSGNYVKDGKMTDIEICPSDVEYDAIRREFDKIVWFNK